MLLISHRVNSISQLKKTNSKYGIEIDIRDEKKKLIVVHDPFKNGVNLEKFLKNYNHNLIIANIKSERIEEKVIKLFKKYNIKNFFFLDSSFPQIINLVKKKISKIALRVSYYEGIETAEKLKNKINWIWYDTFFGLPKDIKIFSYLKKLNYKICLVSPELHGIKIDKKSKVFLKIKSNNLVDAVCTKKKYFKNWI
jgi:hypothetical protein